MLPYLCSLRLEPTPRHHSAAYKDMGPYACARGKFSAVRLVQPDDGRFIVCTDPNVDDGIACVRTDSYSCSSRYAQRLKYTGPGGYTGTPEYSTSTSSRSEGTRPGEEATTNNNALPPCRFIFRDKIGLLPLCRIVDNRLRYRGNNDVLFPLVCIATKVHRARGVHRYSRVVARKGRGRGRRPQPTITPCHRVVSYFETK